MAIENVNLVTPQDITLAEAYTKVEGYNGNKETVCFSWATYKDQASRDAGKTPLMSGNSYFPYAVGTMGEILPACYTHLKTLTEFAGATDV